MNSNSQYFAISNQLAKQQYRQSLSTKKQLVAWTWRIFLQLNSEEDRKKKIHVWSQKSWIKKKMNKKSCEVAFSYRWTVSFASLWSITVDSCILVLLYSLSSTESQDFDFKKVLGISWKKNARSYLWSFYW